MADQPTPPRKGEQMTDEYITDATTTPILRIYTVLETDRGGVWAFEPFAMTHCVFVEQSNYYIERSRATALQAERDAALARVAELETLEGASAMVLRYVTDPDWADANSETFRTMPWQALYDELRKDANDFPALLRSHLEAFCDPEFRAMLVPPDLGKGVADE